MDQGITRSNATTLSERLAQARLPEGLRSLGHRFVPCAAVHPDIDSCAVVQVAHFWEVFRWMLPIYGALHFIPMMLFRRDKFVKDPARMLGRAAWGTARSSSFLGVFVVIYQREALCSMFRPLADANHRRQCTSAPSIICTTS